MWNNAVNAWWPLLFYPATDAPRFKKGMIAMICTCAATLGVTWLVWYLERREQRSAKRKAMENADHMRDDSPSPVEKDKPLKDEKQQS
jgi:ACS family pantothenate transporter-like MFS transporter